MQTRKQSLREAVANVAVGMGVSLAVQLAAYPLMGIEVRFGQNIMLTAIFTAVSIARSYAVRRFFNNRGRIS